MNADGVIANASRVRVADLTTAEQFVLGACRCWDAFMHDPDPALAWRELTPVFVFMNVPTALCAFERAFAVLHADAARRLRFNDVEDAVLGIDEVRMLASLARLQRGDAHAALAVLAEALPSHRVRALLPPLARIAAILDAHGHRLPRGPRGPTGRAPPKPAPARAWLGEISWLPLRRAR